MALEAVDGFLTKRAQGFWKGAVVGQRAGRFVMERPGLQPVDLGADPKEAKLSIDGLVQALRQSRKAKVKMVEV